MITSKNKKIRFEDFNVKFNQEQVKNLFEQYEKIGFLYPEKKLLLAPHIQEIIKNWKILVQSKEQFLWILSTNHIHNNNFSSVCAWKQSNFGLQAQHLVSNGNPFLSLKVMLAAQFKAEHHFTKEEVNSSQNWFRPNNRYAYRVFASMYNKLGPQRAGLRLFQYMTLALAEIPEKEAPSIEINLVKGIDLELISFVNQQYGEVFVQAEELNQSDIELRKMNQQYASYNLQRYRKVLKFRCKKRRKIVAVAIVNRAPLGINFSFLENKTYYILDSNLSEVERKGLLAVMNSEIKQYYADFAVGAIPIVTDEMTAKSLGRLKAKWRRAYMQSIWMRSGFALWFEHIYSFLQKIEGRKLIKMTVEHRSF